MAALGLKLKPKNSKKIVVELDAEKFERLAASLGLFSEAFEASLDQAEKDYRSGRIAKISSLRELELSRE